MISETPSQYALPANPMDVLHLISEPTSCDGLLDFIKVARILGHLKICAFLLCCLHMTLENRRCCWRRWSEKCCKRFLTEEITKVTDVFEIFTMSNVTLHVKASVKVHLHFCNNLINLHKT